MYLTQEKMHFNVFGFPDIFQKGGHVTPMALPCIECATQLSAIAMECSNLLPLIPLMHNIKWHHFLRNIIHCTY